MTVSAYFFQPSADPQFLIKASLSFFIGGLALGGALWLCKERLQTLVPSHIAVSPGHSCWWMVGVGVALLALLAEISGQRMHLPALANVSVHIQFGLLVLGIILIGWGLAGEVQWKCFTTERQNGLLLCAITLIGLVVRTWGLDLTARFMQDETIFTDALMQFWHGGNPGLLNGGGLAPMTMVYSYWNAGTVELFGRNLIGLRMASALLGVLAIPTAYGLARVMFDRKLGLIAALFVATFPPHIHFSRISWGHMGDSLFGLMTLMFAGRGIKWNRRADWAFAGVSLGLTQYFYEVGRLLYPPLMVVWFILLMFAWKMKQYRQGIMIGVIGAVIIAAPVYYAAAVRGESFTPRSDVSVIRGDYWNKLFQGGLDDDERRQILIRLTTPFLVYTHHPDSLAEYYGGFAGFVAPQLVPIFLLGVFWVTWRARYPVVVLVMALLFVSSANIFANDGGIAARYVVVAPIIPILMAVGLYGVLRLLSLDRYRLLLTGLAVLVALWQLYFYFGIHLPYYNEQRRRMIPERDIFDAVLRTTDLPLNTEVFLIDPAPSIDYGRANRLYQFLQDSPYQLQAPTQTAFDPKILPHNHNYAFFISPDDKASLNKIRDAFPDVKPPLYTTYPVPEWDQYILLLWMTNH